MRSRDLFLWCALTTLVLAGEQLSAIQKGLSQAQPIADQINKGTTELNQGDVNDVNKQKAKPVIDDEKSEKEALKRRTVLPKIDQELLGEVQAKNPLKLSVFNLFSLPWLWPIAITFFSLSVQGYIAPFIWLAILGANKEYPILSCPGHTLVTCMVQTFEAIVDYFREKMGDD
eukprot:c6570_g1_i1.p1 GENE.c6570_g1_i1~~c6570_g1_i1.p1  ORF type:complete len:173 (+),score=25.92 c6570_g1_i1:29-547(+)